MRLDYKLVILILCLLIINQVNAQEITSTSKGSSLSLLWPVLFLLILFTISAYFLYKKRYVLFFSGIIGIFISCIDFFVFWGMVSSTIFYPFLHSLCWGSCTGEQVFLTSLFGFLILGYLFGFIIEQIVDRRRDK
mgnify:CR=1 FL=1